MGVSCISAGILNGAGKVIAAIGVAGPTSRLSRERISEVSAAVLGMAIRCADELIHQPLTAQPVES